LVEQYLINTVDDNGSIGVSALSDNAGEFRPSSTDNFTKGAVRGGVEKYNAEQSFGGTGIAVLVYAGRGLKLVGPPSRHVDNFIYSTVTVFFGNLNKLRWVKTG